MQVLNVGRLVVVVYTRTGHGRYQRSPPPLQATLASSPRSILLHAYSGSLLATQHVNQNPAVLRRTKKSPPSRAALFTLDDALFMTSHDMKTRISQVSERMEMPGLHHTRLTSRMICGWWMQHGGHISKTSPMQQMIGVHLCGMGHVLG